MYLHAERVHQVRCDAHLILRQLDVLDSNLTHQLLRLSHRGGVGGGWGGGDREEEREKNSE